MQARLVFFSVVCIKLCKYRVHLTANVTRILMPKSLSHLLRVFSQTRKNSCDIFHKNACKLIHIKVIFVIKGTENISNRILRLFNWCNENFCSTLKKSTALSIMSFQNFQLFSLQLCEWFKKNVCSKMSSICCQCYCRYLNCRQRFNLSCHFSSKLLKLINDQVA